MHKKLIFTVAVWNRQDGQLLESFALCQATLARYAIRIGADYISSNQPKLGHHSQFPHIEKFNLAPQLETYDRVLFVDSDIFIKPAAPDIFEACPSTDRLYLLDQRDHLDGFPEVRAWHERSWRFLRGKAPDIGSAYYNTGVMVLSKVHRELFSLAGYFDGPTWEQEYLIYQIHRLKLPTAKLPLAFNTIYHYSTQREKDQAWFLHFSGAAKYQVQHYWKTYYGA